MKSIVLFGAGKSAIYLIDYLAGVCSENNWTLTIGDLDPESIRNKGISSPFIFPVRVDVENTVERSGLIREADLVISLLPPSLHLLIAQDCLTHSKNLLTASYVDDEIRKLSAAIENKNLFFLCEMGLDPGIDHMSAMQIIHKIQSAAGKITAFRSHTGGLVAPESDDNPWHYKISWNPANVVRAGAAGAVYREAGEIIATGYKDLFAHPGMVEIKPLGKYAFYPNRDSLSYVPVYGLEAASSFVRTTLRHPVFCEGWKNLVSAGLTDDRLPVLPPIKTIADWSRSLLPFVDASNRYLYDQLGLFEDEAIPAGKTSAKILQSLLEKNWKMKDTDRDMILMMHEFEYEVKGRKHFMKSSLVVKGENAMRTAMAKTVGLPLGIAARLILEGKMPLKGLRIPIVPEIYEPVLKELAGHGIRFQEEIS
jgi:saccharopine dehydrogenase-like NADP-dependent oxidoreductase